MQLSSHHKTTCDIYHSLPLDDLLPSVRAYFYAFVHGQDQFSVQSTLAFPQNKPKNLLKKALCFTEGLYEYNLAIPDKIDVLFSYFNGDNNYLGIQQYLARQCRVENLKTGIIYPETILLDSNFDVSFTLQSRSFVSLKIQKQIIDQCRFACQFLQDSYLIDNFNKDIYIALANRVFQLEANATRIQRLLEIKKPKLVVLMNSKVIGDVATQIACANTGIPSMLALHGFPQRSQYPFETSFIMSYCPHHDHYLKTLSFDHCQIKGLGWLEPRVTLADEFQDLHDAIEDPEKVGYKILFLSQMSGWKTHACESLLESIPAILKALDTMPEVKSITLRLRQAERNDLVLTTLLRECKCSKLKISVNPSLKEDLEVNNLVMSLSSTGLLYGPYLGMRAIEIRDAKINSVWGGTVLPHDQVYQIDQELDPENLKEFILDLDPSGSHKRFYNHRCELKAFSKIISDIT